MSEIGTMRVKSGLAEMLKGGVIMDVVDAEQAKIAEEAGACVLGDHGLLRVDHIHDHAALEHLGETALDAHRAVLSHAPECSGTASSPCAGKMRP